MGLGGHSHLSSDASALLGSVKSIAKAGAEKVRFGVTGMYTRFKNGSAMLRFKKIK